MGRLLPLLFLVQIVLAVIALISCISADESDLRGLPKIVWVLVIVLLPLIGSIAYFLAGRPVATTAGSGWAREAHRPARPVAPDDDPEFLRSIDRQQLKRWEEDLRRREEEIRKREDDRPDG